MLICLNSRSTRAWCACFDAFCHTITKKTVVVVDNASIHRSKHLRPEALLEETRLDHQVSESVFSSIKPDRNPVAAHQIHLAPVLGLCVSKRVERGIRSHPEPSRIRISNYFCLDSGLGTGICISTNFTIWLLLANCLMRHSMAKLFSTATRNRRSASSPSTRKQFKVCPVA